MMGQKQQSDTQLFYTNFCLNERIGADNRYRRILEVLDFSFVRPAVADLYGKVGNPSIDPIVVLKLMLISFLENIPSERELLRRLPERLDWLWFCRYDINSQLPDHSVPSKARRRWGLKIFEQLFANILQQCMDAGLVDGETVYIDSSLIQGNVSLDSLQPSFYILAQQTYERLESNCDVPIEAPPVESNAPDKTTKLSPTDPEARARIKGQQKVFGYQEHRCTDDAYGIITASETTDAAVHEGETLEAMVEQHEFNTQQNVSTVVADKAYGRMSNYSYLQRRGITPCIPHADHNHTKSGKFSRADFQYDPQKDCYVCPAGNVLSRQTRKRTKDRPAHVYKTGRGVCQACAFRERCYTGKYEKRVDRHIDQDKMDWADSCLSGFRRRHLMSRRRHIAEGSFGDAATHHGFKRARWRNRWRVKIQNLLIASIQNLRKLLKYGWQKKSPALVAAGQRFWGYFCAEVCLCGHSRAAWNPEK